MGRASGQGVLEGVTGLTNDADDSCRIWNVSHAADGRDDNWRVAMDRHVLAPSLLRVLFGSLPFPLFRQSFPARAAGSQIISAPDLTVANPELGGDSPHNRARRALSPVDRHREALIAPPATWGGTARCLLHANRRRDIRSLHLYTTSTPDR